MNKQLALRLQSPEAVNLQTSIPRQQSLLQCAHREEIENAVKNIYNERFAP